jgi:hypothetical protein
MAMRLSVVQILLQAGAKGPEVDDMLLDSVMSPQKCLELIETLVHHGAQDFDKVRAYTETLFYAIPYIMQVQDRGTRHQIMQLLLAPIKLAGVESSSITQLVIDILQKPLEDIDLLQLLCTDGNANLNLLEGYAVKLATCSSNPEVLNIVLRSGGCSPTSTTIEFALDAALCLPSTDPSRAHKFQRLLQEAVPQQVSDNLLLREVKKVVAQKDSLDVVHILLSAKANVDSNGGASLVVALVSPGITDMLLHAQPNSLSLAVAFAEATKMTGLAKYNTYENCSELGREANKSMKLFAVQHRNVILGS